MAPSSFIIERKRFSPEHGYYRGFVKCVPVEYVVEGRKWGTTTDITKAKRWSRYGSAENVLTEHPEVIGAVKTA